MKPSAGPVQSLMRSVAVGACALIGAGARQGDPRPIAIVHGTLVDGRGELPLGDATLLIRGRVIEAVSGAGKLAIPKDARVTCSRGRSNSLAGLTPCPLGNR